VAPQTVSTLLGFGYVIIGGGVTMLGQAIADRRATKRTEREARERHLSDEIAALRASNDTQALALAELRGLVTGARGLDMTVTQTDPEGVQP
jgi:hypothetical protein